MNERSEIVDRATDERLTPRQAAIVGVYTGTLAGPFADYHKLAETLMARPIWTHQFADPELAKELTARARPLFLAICAPDLEAEERLRTRLADRKRPIDPHEVGSPHLREDI